MNFWKLPRHKPLTVAHRGSCGVAPENTIAAFRQALRDGADAIELDVRLTRDDELVVFHDSHLSRTSSGSGLVRKWNLDELRLLSAGVWFAPEFSSQKIPLLGEVFHLVKDKAGINVEMKLDRGSGKGNTLAEKCCALIKQFGMEEQVLLTSFDHSLIEIAKAKYPSITAGILLHPLKQMSRSPVNKAQALKCDYIIFGSGTLRKRLTERAHKQNIRVAEYTVNTERRLQRALRYGVDAIITNHPEMIRRFVERDSD